MKQTILFISIVVIACAASSQPKPQVTSEDLYAVKFALRPPNSFLKAPGDTVLEKMIHRPYLKNQKKALKNNQYLIENLVALNFSRKYVNSPDLLKRKIFFDLNNLNNTAREDNKNLPSFIKELGSHGVYRLSSRQLVRIFLILKALKDKKFLKKIGQLIENDLHDFDAVKYGHLKTEHGGLVVLEPNVKFWDIKSATALPNKIKNIYPEQFNTSIKSSNNFYELPKKSYQKNQFIAEFHIHATENDNSKYAGPSFAAGKNKITGRNILYLDLGIAIRETIKLGESHNFVITKLKGNNFNIDYYGGEKREFGPPRIIILDIGNYSY